MFVGMQLSSFSTTIYLHRVMAHKGLKLHPAVAMLMQVQLWLFTGLITREWVAVHRKHHHNHADQRERFGNECERKF